MGGARRLRLLGRGSRGAHRQARQEFRAGFLGLASFGWSTLVEVAEATPEQREQATAALASHILAAYGAPDAAAARAAAEEEIGFAASLCDHPPGTVLALARWSRMGPSASASVPCTAARPRTAISAPCRSSPSSRPRARTPSAPT